MLPAPAAASEPLGERTLTAGDFVEGPCFEAAESAPGAASFAVTPPSFGYLRIELDGGGGDWDVAAFSGGRVVTAAANSGPDDVATGFGVEGEAIRVQACRAPGASPTARVRVSFRRFADPNGPAPRILRVELTDRSQTAALARAGLDVTHNVGAAFADVVAYGPDDRATLARLGLRYTTADRDPGRGALRTVAARRAGETFPSGRTSYRRLFDYEQEMKELAAEHPDLVELFTLPYPSLEGRPIQGIELGDNPGADEGEPVFAQLGLHHGREWPAGEMTLEWAYELLASAEAGDPAAQRRLRDSTTILVPVVNPDGFNISREAAQVRRDYGARTGRDGAGIPTLSLEFQRKNCRIPGNLIGDCGRVMEQNLGVDPNRNYGVGWGGVGAGARNGDETFRGARPFSEPEVGNVRWLFTRNQVTAASSQHSYAGLILHPPGVRGSGPLPDRGLFERLGAKLARQAGYDSIPGHHLYDSSGVMDDWTYGATGAITFTPEIGTQDFHAPFGQVLREWGGGRRAADGGMRAAFYTLSDFALSDSGHAVLAGSGPPGGRLELRMSFAARTARVLSPIGRPLERRKFRNRLLTTADIGPDGAFEVHLNPAPSPLVGIRGGRMGWQVTCLDAAGAEIGSREIRVSRGERLELDLADGC